MPKTKSTGDTLETLFNISRLVLLCNQRGIPPFLKHRATEAIRDIAGEAKLKEIEEIAAAMQMDNVEASAAPTGHLGKRLKALEDRVQELENKADDHDERLDSVGRDIQAIERNVESIGRENA